MLKVKVLKKLPSPYVLKCDNNTLSIAKELFLAGKKETNLGGILQAALFEEINHISFSERFSDYLLNAANSHISLGKVILSGEMCQTQIVLQITKYLYSCRAGDSLWCLASPSWFKSPDLNRSISGSRQRREPIRFLYFFLIARF
jgi:hypothetical protein